jgi:nitrogen regulatory protein P-II 1
MITKQLAVFRVMHNILIKGFIIVLLYRCIMKKIEAVIPSTRLGTAFEALDALSIGGLTYYDSKGRGQVPRPRLHSGRGTSTYIPEFNVNSLIMLVVKDPLVSKIIDTMLERLSTGLAGEGKIFVSDIDDAVDIGSRTRGESAI